MPDFNYSDKIRKHLWYPMFKHNTIVDTSLFSMKRSVTERLENNTIIIIGDAFRWGDTPEKHNFWKYLQGETVAWFQ